MAGSSPSEGAPTDADAETGNDESPDWQRYFGFEEPYDNQGDAVERILRTGRAKGYLAMEGPCGTGKTMAALTAGATLVRETDLYERILVVTPVKQQLQQFVEDLRTMNEGLEESMDGIALVGKPDLCPYEREDLFGDDASVYDRCEDLREDTAHLVEADGSGAQEAVADAVVEAEETDDDEKWWDPQLASDLATAARPDAVEQQSLGEDTLSTAGAQSPYRPEQPHAPESMVEGGEAPLYCPFEADWYARNKGSPVGFDDAPGNVLTVDEYLPGAVERGTCPHRAMGILIRQADVVVGNYNHLFDPTSRNLIAEILDDETFVVVDEGHRIEERVRDLLSDRVGKHTFTRARNDCNVVVREAQQTDEHRQRVEDVLSVYDVPLDAVEQARAFYDDVIDWMDERVRAHLDREFEGWRADTRTLPEGDREIPLRDPETPERDELTEWAEREGYDGTFWRTLATVGAAVEDTIDELDLPRQSVAGPVGAIMGSWWEKDHATYLREIELEHSPADDRSVDAAYETVYTPGLLLYNCMPAEPLREIFDGVGGGVLMSATLEPLDVFTHVSGLSMLADEAADIEASGGHDGDAADGDAADGDAADGDAAGGDAAGGNAADGDDVRFVDTANFDLPFPRENRASFLVDAIPFTARNRGNPDDMRPLGDGWNETRDEYAHALRALARSPGNVLVAMPNYREATWAGTYLEETVDKPLLVDESSSNEETERRKRAFFRGEGKVMVTSARGTLTEGVDYDGEKLSTCAVVGVPLVNVGSPRVRAVRRAYGDAFGENRAFEYALTVPAVRRARQAIGRVIRGTEEVGVRAFVGRRWCPGERHSVFEYLPEDEQAEFRRMRPDFLADQLDSFWDRND